LFFKEGGAYDGDWHQNKMSGNGILYYGDGQIAYDGKFFSIIKYRSLGR